MLEIEQRSNIKPDSWYKEYIKMYNKIIYSDDPILIQENEPSLEIRLENLRASDKDIEVLNEIDKYAESIYQKFEEYQHKIFMNRRDEEYRNSEEYKKDKKEMGELNDRYWNVPPPRYSEEDLEHYHFVVRDTIYHEPDLIFNCNSIKKNKALIEIFNYRINRLKEQPDITKLDFYKPGSWERWVLFTKARLKLCKKAVNKGYLVTGNLMDIFNNIKEYEYDIICEEKRKHPKAIKDLDFRDFQYSNEQIFELIKKNEKWHDIKRDLTIYQERQKGKSLDELAMNFGIKFNSISMVVSKVQGAINYYQGKLFEDFVEKRLKESKLFEKVIKEAGKGEADIIAYPKNNGELYIFSLKNIKINRKPYWLTKEELRPELERAKLQSLDYKIYLILLVFDNHNNKVKQFQIDYNNPKNIDISGVSNI